MLAQEPHPSACREPTQRGRGEGGFTLIELLVVIVIVGILTGIAIPTFTGSRNVAYDTGAKALGRTAETAAEAYAVDHERSGRAETEEKKGPWSNMTVAALEEYEPAIRPCPMLREPCLKEPITLLEEGREGYEFVIESPQTGNEFLVREEFTKEKREVHRTCKHAGVVLKVGETIAGCVGGKEWS